MSLLDFSKNCDITTNSFSDDLLSYSLKDGKIVWSDNTEQEYSVGENLFTDSETSDFWTPVFISDDNLIKNKLISHYGSIIGDSSFVSGRIGREDFITFNPKFKNWNVSRGSMVIDWILNRSRSPKTVEAGLMYWKRKKTAVTGPITFFPAYSKIKHNNIIYIKIDDEKIRRISPDPVTQSFFRRDSTLGFNYTQDNADTSVVDLKTPGSDRDPEFVLFGSDDVELWIPDGDQLLYFSNQSEKRQNNIDGIGSRSYISGGLYKYYNIFYNSLTAKEKLAKITDSRSTHRLRQYKKLAHSLSTSPFSSEFFAALLSKPSEIIKNSINNYLASNIDSINTDIKNLSSILATISREYSIYEIQNSSNIIKNNDQLFSKLYNKYGAKLQISGQPIINYKPILKYGDSVIIEEIGETLVNKDVKETIISNNKKISIGNLSLETSIGQTISSILLKNKNETTNNIVLYDSVKPQLKENSNINILLEKNNNVDNSFRFDPDNLLGPVIPVVADYDPNINIFYWGPKDISNDMDGWIRYCPKLKAVNTDLLIKYTDVKFPNQAQEIIDREFTCVWTKVSGPDCRFVDLAKTQTNKSYNVAYTNDIMIVPSSTGKYVIKCVVSSPYGSYTKIKTLFIVDGREKIVVGFDFNNRNPTFAANPNFGTYIKDGVENLFGIFTAGTENRAKISDIDLNRSRTENVPVNLNKDKLQIFISGLDSIAIHRNGLYFPIRTNYYVERVTANSRPIEKLNSNGCFFAFNDVGKDPVSPKISNSSLTISYNTNNTTIKLDRIILRNIRNETKECSQCYSLYQPKFTSYLSGNRKPFFSRSNKNPEGFSLQEYLPDGPDIYFRSETREYNYPIISSDIAPPITTYGGYGYEVLDKISINNLSSLKKPDRNILNDGIVAKLPNILPAATGYKLDYKDDWNSLDESIRNYKFCYQENIMPDGHIKFNKGTFVPNSGWVVGDNRNLSNVLKFNPGARKSFSFAGPGILGLSNYTNTSIVSPNTFSSSIELNINPEIRWETGGTFCPAPVPPLSNETLNRNKLASIKGAHNMKNQLNKELVDQYVIGPNDYNHGYRTLNGGYPKPVERNLASSNIPQNDEFNIGIDELSNTFSYSFNVVGPNKKIGLDEESKQFITLYQQGIDPGSQGSGEIVRNFIEQKSGLGIRDPRINNLTIKDVEIQLNFLNYVNTKNLIVWLEVEFSSSEKGNMSLVTPDRSPPYAQPQIKADNNFIDQFIPKDTYKAFTNPEGVNNRFFISNNISVGNDSVNQHLKALTDMNSRDSVGEKVILYLLNQETIQNKEYNFSLRFSDSANKHNVLYDQNLYSSGTIDPDQFIVSNQNSINPTKQTDDRDTCENSTYTNLNKINRLNINNNTFHKLSGRNLFNGVNPIPPEGCGYLFSPFDSSTKFTLHITLLEEEDEMFPIDTISNNELYTNISSVENSISSANLFNNLCSWELILHTEDVKKPVTSQVNSLANYGGTDSLSSIEYGSDPKYPGYSFIANLRDSKFLLPLVNMNAPTTFFQNYNACEYADSELIGKGALIRSPRFPTEALLFILAGTAVGDMTGSLVGVLVGGLGATYSLRFDMLFNYFQESRRIPLLELAQRETFDIEYTSYPFGNSDKILLNISKDNVFWYKVEASIFKLSNTPALPLKEYKLIKSDNKLFKFDFTTIDNRKDIIDDIFVPYIAAKAAPEDADEETKIKYQDLDNDVYSSFNFMSVDELVFANKLIHSENIFQYVKQPNQTLVIINHTIPYYLISIGDSLKLDANNLSAIVMSKALIYKDEVYKTVLVLNKRTADLTASALFLPEDVVVICGSENTTFEQPEYSPISLYGLVNDQPPNDTIPDLTFSTNSLGSYGDGSSVKDKNILSRKVQINKIDPIYNQLNSFNGDKYYRNELTITFPDDTPPIIKINNPLEAYPVYYDSTNNSIINNDFYHIYNNTFNDSNVADNTENIQFLLDKMIKKDNRTYTKEHLYNMMYLKIKDNNRIQELNRSDIAYTITIENNYTYNDTIERINSDQLKTLTDRLDILNKESDATLDPLVGNASSTNTLLQSDSIFYIQQHYDTISEDPPDCSRLSPVITCYKDRTYSKLQQLYSERSQILKLLQKQATKKTDNEYILDPIAQKYHTGSEGIIPDQKANIVVNSDKSLSITYEKVSDDYYWINIDPKQSISIAEEMRPKVLKSIKYICSNTNPAFNTGGVDISDFNNICPDWLRVDGLENDIMTVQADSQGTTYSFKEDFITTQKESWEDRIWGWKTQTIERRFRINADQSIPGRGIDRTNSEVLVTAIETYEVALDQIEGGIKNAIDAGLSKTEAIELLIEEGLMKNDFSGDIYGGLKDGIGNFVSKPSRVYNIFNLDDTNELKVQFRKAPRSMRGIDAIGTILRYGENMSYRPQSRPPLDPLDAWGIGRTESLINNFYQWKCLQKDPLATPDSGGSLVEAKTPEFFKLLNEMVFRNFFGSVDRTENKTDELRSLYDFEMIPYEYFTGKPPPRSDFDGDINIPDNPIV